MTTTTNAAGGDYQGLTTKPIQYRGRKQHTGLDWDQITADYIARGGQVDASVWPNTGKVVVIGGTARSSRKSVHTFVEADQYDEPAAPTPSRVRPKIEYKRNPPNIKITAEQRVVVGRRYQDGASLTELAADYGCSVTLITKTLKAIGIPTRSRIEAGKVRRERSAS